MSYLGAFKYSPNEDPMDSFLQGSNEPSYSQQLSANAPEMQSQAAKVAGLTSTAATASLPFMMTPAGAAVSVGATLASQYMAQKAADERAKRQKEMEIAQNLGHQEQGALQNMVANIRGALR